MTSIIINCYDGNIELKTDDLLKVFPDMENCYVEENTVINYSQFEFCKIQVFQEIIDIILNDKFVEFKDKITNEKIFIIFADLYNH